MAGLIGRATMRLCDDVQGDFGSTGWRGRFFCRKGEQNEVCDTCLSEKLLGWSRFWRWFWEFDFEVFAKRLR
jgi:hypothetical protein